MKIRKKGMREEPRLLPYGISCKSNGAAIFTNLLLIRLFFLFNWRFPSHHKKFNEWRLYLTLPVNPG